MEPGERRRALVVPTAIVVFTAAVGVHLSLIYLGVIHSSFFMSVGYIIILTAAGWELADNILRTADLAERLKVREAELAESHQRMALAVDAVHMGLWVWDIPRDQFWSTDRGLTLVGLSPGAHPSLADIFENIHPDDRQRVRLAVEDAIGQNRPISVEYRVSPSPGKTRWIFSRGLVERGDRGEPLKMRGVSVDITERKTAELEAAYSRTEIAHLSRVNMLGELSSSIAHELNQPLAAILGNAEAAESLLESGSPDLAELRQMLGDIVQQDVRAGGVIQHLRMLLKKSEVQTRPMDVIKLVRDVVELVRNDLINRGVQLALELGAELPLVRGDDVQLQQVLLNLVINACDAMAEIHPSQRLLTIRTDHDSDGGVRICVIDCGCGIPVDLRKKIFEPFHTTKVAGLGMGLTISRTIVEAHGGRIWAEDADGTGTRLCMVLPASQED